MDIISRLPGCAGQAADAVSAYTQVKMEDAPKFLKIPKSECPDTWIRLPRQKELLQIVVQYGSPSRSSWTKSGRSSNWMERNKNMIPMWRELNKEVDLRESTSFLDHVHLECTQRQCEISKDIVDNHRTMFESRISAGWTEKLPRSENLRFPSWFYDIEGHAKKCVERFCEFANRTTQELHKVSIPCLDDHHFKEKELKSVGELSKVCSQIVVKCWYLARIGRPDIRWSANKLARSITKWAKACDKRLNRLISYIHHTSEYKQYCHVGNTAKQCRLGLFQDSDFAGDLEDSKSTSGGTLCIFGSHTFVLISWMCNKQTSVSHSSTESDIISLVAGLRNLWDLIVAVLHGKTNQSKQVQGILSTPPTRKKIPGKIDWMI